MQENIFEISQLGASNNENGSNELSFLISSLDEKLENIDKILTTESLLVNQEASESQEIEQIINNLDVVIIDNSNEVLESNDNISIPTYDNIINIIDSIKTETIFSINDTNDDSFNDSLGQELLKLNRARKRGKIANFIVDKAKFLTSYAIVSSFVFFILLGGVNYNAYSKIAYNYINPENLKNSSREILNSIDNSKIKVFADEDNSFLGKEQQENIQKNLEEDNTQLRDTYFSPKKLVPLKSNVNLDIEITPYENRIMIPKIGKNIPLVDVDSRRGNLDFNNLENLFMKELEKGVLRYPGTAKPGDNGNTFIFGHSSNYAWEKGDYNDVFALLDNLEMGDEIIVYYNQKKYVYVINEKKVIKPGNVEILNRDPNKKELSLMTCWPIGTSINRLITFAELKNVTNQ